MINVKCFPLGVLAANCYLVTNEEDRVSLLVDPGDYSETLDQQIEQFGSDRLQYILLTHGHFDHIGGAAAFKRKHPNAKIVISTADAGYLQNDRLNLSYHFDVSIEPFTADLQVGEGDELPFGSHSVKAISTPGHTSGGVCYIIERTMFTGDTLISGTTGRTDFPTGSLREMAHSIRRLAKLEGDYSVYCGHGGASTLQNERENNYFMRECIYDDLS